MPDVEVLIQCEGGETSRRLLHLEEPAFSVGRHAQNALCLEGDSVSREHARIELRARHIRVADASRNGTLAGTTLLRLQSLEVGYGTPIRIGRYTLVIGADPSTAVRPDGVRVSPPRDSTTAVPPDQARVSPSAELSPSMIELRREIHRKLLENLDLTKLDPAKIDDPSMRPRVLTALRRIVRSLDERIAPEVDRDVLIGELADEALGLGPLERFLADPAVTEIMVVDPANIYVEKGGSLVKTATRFTDDERVRAVIERIVTPLGRRIDESSPLVDARLRDGSRVNAIIKPLALRGSCITIRRFPSKPLTLAGLIELRALTPAMGRFLVRSVAVRRNLVISGGTGSGKTTLLNVLSAAIPEGERIVTIEDAAELQLKQPHVVSLETRPSNMEGKGEFTIRDLVRNALRMRPDRIVVGECRGGEALDMLQAMNTGHDGSLTTTHANSPAEALARLETLALMGGVDLPSRAIREQIASALDLVVHTARMRDGTRKVVGVSEVVGMEGDIVTMQEIMRFAQHGVDEQGQVIGEFSYTGGQPVCLKRFAEYGIAYDARELNELKLLSTLW